MITVQPDMTDADLMLFAQEFRDEILTKAQATSSESFCYAISLPMEAHLMSHGFECELTEGSVAGGCHFFLTLPDGRILDPTADQFRKPKGSEMPPVYLGERPAWYGKKGEPMKPVKLPRPDAEHRELHSFFSALAERGVGGEKENAARKLEHLCRYFDFTKRKAADMKDIFANVAKTIKKDHEARHLMTFPRCSDSAQWVKWAIANGLNCETTLRTDKDWKLSLYAHVGIGNLKAVSTLAERIAFAFEQSWQRFSKTPGVLVTDRSIFMRGLYDGMQDDIRKHGEPLPTPPARKPEKGKRSKANSATCAIHPYTLAVELGRALRIDTPTEKILSIIDARTGTIQDQQQAA